MLDITPDIGHIETSDCSFSLQGPALSKGQGIAPSDSRQTSSRLPRFLVEGFTELERADSTSIALTMISRY